MSARSHKPADAATAPDARETARRGYTVIELLAVMAIIGVLVGLVVAAGFGVQERGRIGRARAELAALATALEQYKNHYGDYPWVPDDSDGDAILLNALCGNLGPQASEALTDKGRTFVELARFSLQDPDELPAVNSTTPLVENAFVDPWGNRYVYRYRASSTGSTWTSPSFLLFSKGPDGECDPDTGSASGLISDMADVSENADNIYAGR